MIEMSFLQGKKTYIVAVVTAFAAFFSLLSNEPYWGVLFGALAAGLIGIRDAIKQLGK